MPKISFSRIIVFLVVIFCFKVLAAQTDSTATIDIYRQAYKAAFKDHEISSDERNLLLNLQKSLNISNTAEQLVRQEIVLSEAHMRDQSGRWPLVMQNIAYGVGLYGWGIPFLLDVDDEKWYVGGEMLSLAGSFYLTYQVTKNMDISHARAQMLRYGSVIGLHAAFGLGWMAFPGEQKLLLGSVMLGVPAGMIVTDHFYRRWQPGLGQSWALTQWGELGYSGVSNVYKMIDPSPKEPDNDQDDEEYSREITRYNDKYEHWQRRKWFISAFGHPLGMAIERRFFADRQYTFGDALMLTNGRYFGLFNGFMIWDLVSGDTDKNLTDFSCLLSRTVGSCAGLILMDRYIRNLDFTTGQAILMATGEFAGILFGIGTGIIFEIDNSRVMDLLAIGGGWSGFFLTRKILAVPMESQAQKPDEVKISLSPALIPVRQNLLPGIALNMQF